MPRSLSSLLTLAFVMSVLSPGASAQDAPASQASEAQAQATPGCSPPCRAGHVCRQGMCVSACNPPCEAGQLCNAQGECVPEPQILVAPSESQHAAAGRQPADAGWADLGGVIGVVGAAGVVGLTIGTILENGEDNALYFGGGALALHALAGPIAALGGNSARSNPLIQGSPTVRTLSWIGYGTALAGGLGLLVAGLSADDNEVPVGLTGVVGGLGALSLVGFAVEAFNAAADARSAVGRAAADDLQLAPSLALSRDMNGQLAPGLGVGGTF